MKKWQLTQMVLGTFMVLAFASDAFASGDWASSPEHQKVQAARESCASQLSIALPEPGSGEKLSKENHKALFACMKEQGINFPHHRKFHREMKACLAKAGVTMPAFTPGEKPIFDDTQKAAMKACRQELRSQRSSVNSAHGAVQSN